MQRARVWVHALAQHFDIPDSKLEKLPVRLVQMFFKEHVEMTKTLCGAAALRGYRSVILR